MKCSNDFFEVVWLIFDGFVWSKFIAENEWEINGYIIKVGKIFASLSSAVKKFQNIKIHFLMESKCRRICCKNDDYNLVQWTKSKPHANFISQ